MTFRLEDVQYTALEALDAALGHTGYALIGAAALGFHIELPRYTADLDLIVACEASYLDARLIGRGWQRDDRLAYRWQLQQVHELPWNQSSSPGITATQLTGWWSRRQGRMRRL